MTTDRKALTHEHSLAAIAVDGVGMPLGMWAGRGDYAKFSDEARDQAGRRALTELDAAITELTAFREKLAVAVLGDLYSKAALDALGEGVRFCDDPSVSGGCRRPKDHSGGGHSMHPILDDPDATPIQELAQQLADRATAMGMTATVVGPGGVTASTEQPGPSLYLHDPNVTDPLPPLAEQIQQHGPCRSRYKHTDGITYTCAGPNGHVERTGHRHGDGVVTWTDEQAAAGPCPSLYLHKGRLISCGATWEHDRHQPRWPKGDDKVAWLDSAAVPVPWPKDQEPPAGINTLRDAGDSDDDYGRGDQLQRVDEHLWQWINPGNPLKGEHYGVAWESAANDADGDLIVVRP